MKQQRSPRLPVRTAVSFSSGESGENRGEGRVTNLSVSGCTLETDQPLEKGAYLTLRFELPGKNQIVETDLAAVRWVRGQEYGVEFIRMSSKTQEQIQHLIYITSVRTPEGDWTEAPM